MSEELKAALARIACLEGEIAKRDETIARLEPQLNRAIQANYDLREELAACRVAVENCEVFRARIAELESQYQRDVCGLNNEGDPIGGDPAGGYANDNARLRAELAAIKAQDTVGEVVGWYRLDRPYETTSYPSVCATWHKLGAPVAPLYAAPVSAGANLIRFDFTNAEGQPDSKMMTHDEMRQRYSDLLISNALALGGGSTVSADGVDERAAFEAECGRLGLTLYAGSDCRYAKEIQCAWMLWQAQTKLVNKKALDLIDRVYKNHGQWLEKDPFLRELRNLLTKGVSNEG